MHVHMHVHSLPHPCTWHLPLCVSQQHSASLPILLGGGLSWCGFTLGYLNTSSQWPSDDFLPHNSAAQNTPESGTAPT